MSDRFCGEKPAALPLTAAEERLLRFARSVGGIPIGWEPAPTVDRLLATIDACRSAPPLPREPDR